MGHQLLVVISLLVCTRVIQAAPQPLVLINSTEISSSSSVGSTDPDSELDFTNSFSSSGPSTFSANAGVSSLAPDSSYDDKPRLSSGPTAPPPRSSSGPTPADQDSSVSPRSSSGPTPAGSEGSSLPSIGSESASQSTLSGSSSDPSTLSDDSSRTSGSSLGPLGRDSDGSPISTLNDKERLPDESEDLIVRTTDTVRGSELVETTTRENDDFVPSASQSSSAVSTVARNSVDRLGSSGALPSSVGELPVTRQPQTEATAGSKTTFDGSVFHDMSSSTTATSDFVPSVSPSSVGLDSELNDNIDRIGIMDTGSTELSNESGGSSEETIAISRYVPPLDPIKHMLMASETKESKVSEDAKNSETTPMIGETSESAPNEGTSANIEDQKVSVTLDETANPSKAETEGEGNDFKHEKDSVIVKSVEILALLDKGTSKMNESEDNSTPSSTAKDVPEENFETASVVTVDTIQKTTTDIVEEPEKNKDGNTPPNSELFKNLEIPLDSDKLQPVEEENREEFSVSKSTVMSSTTEKMFKDKEEEILMKSSDQEEQPEISVLADTSTSDGDEKSTVESELRSTEGRISVDDSSLSTESVPETTFETHVTKLTDSEKSNDEKETEDLEFRSVKLPILNSSKVVYTKVVSTPSQIDDEVSNPETTTSVSDDETTVSAIVTTIRDFLLSTITERNLQEGSSKLPETDSVPKLDAPSSTDSSGLSTAISGKDVGLEESTPEFMDAESVQSKQELSESKNKQTETTVATEYTTEKLSSSQFVDDKESDSKLVTETTAATSSEEIKAQVEREELRSSVVKLDVTTLETLRAEFTEEPITETTAIELLDVSSEQTSEQNFEPEKEPTTTFKPSDYGINISGRYVSGNNTDMVAAVQFLHYHDKASSEQCFKLVDAHWNYATNLTEENKKKQLAQTLEYSLFHKEAWKNATSFAWKSFNDTLLRRWFRSLSVLGTAALPEEKLNEFNRLKAEMKNTYSTAKICPYVSRQSPKKAQIQTEKDCRLTLEPDLTRILTKSRDYDELTHVWKAWRDAAGKPIREKYLRFVKLSNKAATLNGFSDTGDMWREAYESASFQQDLEALWDQLKPLYEHLHAYVRRKLIQQYGDDKIKKDGPIPAHLFGNMWAQSWVSLLDITQPFSGKPSVDVTPIMEAKNMTAFEMFKISEEFFTSLGLKPMPEEFWKHSLIEKPKDREIICHASAWDFCNGKDYRIKQCTDITMEDLITVHHEMGHIQYFLQYARQPNVFREGANPGFHEAIGDVLALSVSTPNHLKSIGLLEEVAQDPEGDLNFLLRTALDKVSFLPSGYLIDLWRWGLFSGEIKPEEMNTKWWELRLKYQGICPPVKRTDTDFDPGAKYHVPGNVPYIRYFVSFVIQFQFHKVLCDAAGHTGPLYKCDIYRSKEAGQILSQVMELGSSEHWSEAMKIMTGGATNKMDAGPILEYFQPLIEFLKEQNKNETLGWKSDDPTVCP